MDTRNGTWINKKVFEVYITILQKNVFAKVVFQGREKKEGKNVTHTRNNRASLFQNIKYLDSKDIENYAC